MDCPKLQNTDRQIFVKGKCKEDIARQVFGYKQVRTKERLLSCLKLWVQKVVCVPGNIKQTSPWMADRKFDFYVGFSRNPDSTRLESATRTLRGCWCHCEASVKISPLRLQNRSASCVAVRDIHSFPLATKSSVPFQMAIGQLSTIGL
jgi:hypothetical protein